MVFAAAMVALSGCQGAHLHNATKAAVAAGAQKEYQKANITEVINVEQQNLDKLLDAELTAVRENHKLRFELDTLRMADDGTVSIGDWVRDADKKLGEIGFRTDAESTNGQSVLHFLDEQDEIESAWRRLYNRMELVGLSTASKLPVCAKGTLLPESWDYLDTLSDIQQKGFLEIDYEVYKKQCERIQAGNNALPATGTLSAAARDWLAAEAELQRARKEFSSQRKNVEKAEKAYREALKSASAGTGDVAVELKEGSTKLQQAIAGAQSFSQTVGFDILPQTYIDAINTILLAIASGKVSPDATSDPSITTAAEVAKSLPALTQDMENMLAKTGAPSISNLLIELRHQLILRDYATQRAELSDRRVALYKSRYLSLARQAKYWRDFKLALCNLTALQSGRGYPSGQSCDMFSVAGKALSITCTFKEGPTIQPCIISRPWKEVLELGAKFRQNAKRELYVAIAAYAQAQVAETESSEIVFRLIDVDHRKAVAASRSAISAWDNLIGVPIEQLAAYHQSGITEAELGDLIVKALGFGAITAGVAK